MLATLILLIGLFVLILLKIKAISFNFRCLFALLLSLLAGMLIANINFSDFFVQLATLIGNGYIELLKMLIVPLVFVAIVHAIIHLRHYTQGKIFQLVIIVVVALLLLTGISAIIGGAIGQVFHLGSQMTLPDSVQPQHTPTPLVETLLGMLPDNVIATTADNNIIALVIFASILGISTLTAYQKMPNETAILIQLIDALFIIVKQMAQFIIALTPYGVFALLTLTISQHGPHLISDLGSFALAMYCAMMLVLGLHTFIIILIGYNPFHYYRQAGQALLVAFSTRSSFGTLPVTMETLQKRLGASESVSNFAPSIGATIGMNACAGIYPAILVVMTLHMMGQPVTMETLLMVGFINMLASLGISGIPGTAFVAAGVTLSTLGLPFGAITLVQAIDPIIDMGRTATNINGVMTAALFADRFNRRKFDNKGIANQS